MDQLKNKIVPRYSYKPNEASSRNTDQTRVLPAEHLLDIFYLARDESNSVKYLFTLGAVCSRWRSIIKSSPLLWDRWSLADFGPGRNDDQIYKIIKSCLEMSGSQPLSIEFLFKEARREMSGWSLSIKLLFARSHRWVSYTLKHSHRVRRLIIGPINTEMATFIRKYSSQCDFPILEELDIIFGIKPSVHSVFLPWDLSKFPRLQTLNIKRLSTDITERIPSWRQLRKLSLAYIHPTYALVILSRSPSLIKFSARKVSRGAYSPEILPMVTKAIVLPNITHFKWGEVHDEDRMMVMSIPPIYLPKLRHVHLSLSTPRDQRVALAQWDTWDRFFRRNPLNNITTLRIGNLTGCHTTNILTLFSTPSVRDMCLVSVEAKDLLQCLACLSESHDERFPQMKYFSIRCSDEYDWTDPTPLFVAIVSMLQSRQRGDQISPVRQFQFQSHGLHTGMYKEIPSLRKGCSEQIRAFKELHKKGLWLTGDIMDLVLGK